MPTQRMTLNKIKIRIANSKDWQSIIDIYNQAVSEGGKTADTEPVIIEQRKEWLKLHNQKRYPLLVAESDHKVIGWCGVSPHRPGRKALEITAEISYYIDINFRNKGIASRLIEKAIQESRQNGIKNLYALLLEINSPSICILKKFNFEQWGYLPKVAEINNEFVSQIIFGKHI